MALQNITVIGAGTMGNGIAHVFAQNGFTVTLVDVNARQLEKAIETIGKNIDRQIAKGTLTEEQKSVIQEALKLSGLTESERSELEQELHTNDHEQTPDRPAST